MEKGEGIRRSCKMHIEEAEIVPDEDIELVNGWLYYAGLQKMLYEFDKAMEQGAL